MPSSKKNYDEIYKIQDQVLHTLAGKSGTFYLTGGTALDRYYMHHRYSEDVGFFANDDDSFEQNSLHIRRLLSKEFTVSESKLIITKKFLRLWVGHPVELKIELVNDVPERWGDPLNHKGIRIDTPGNILANKLTAITSRDEPKDIFDIVCLAEQYAFNWEEVFLHAMRKANISELDVPMRLKSFPADIMKKMDWLRMPVKISAFIEKLEIITDDFLFARHNSLGSGKTPIDKAQINI